MAAYVSFDKKENPRKCKRDINIKLTEIQLSLIEFNIKLKVPKCEILDPSDFHDFYGRERRYTLRTYHNYLTYECK
jgi:hypothetical protein